MKTIDAILNVIWQSMLTVAGAMLMLIAIALILRVFGDHSLLDLLMGVFK
jgi:hypothetical protein